MACYTLSNCILKNLVAGKKYITDLLMVFTQEANPFKVALDKSNCIMDLYENIGETNVHVASWLSLMSYQPSNFEIINIDVSSVSNTEELFLKVCSSTKIQQKLIVHSHEGWQNFSYHDEKVIVYDNKPIRVFDRDEAIHELNPAAGSSIIAYSSVIATNQSIITDSKNN
jgi:hypothetical protein